MKTIQLAIVEDEKMIRESLKDFLSSFSEFEITWVDESIENFLYNLKSNRKTLPAIILLDIQLPGMSGIEGIGWIKEKAPNADIIMLTTFEDADNIFNALRAGASSYILKGTPLLKIKEAIEMVHRGGSYMSPPIARKVIKHFNPVNQKEQNLTPRQRQIVQEIVNGGSYQAIADKLFLSLDTVRWHIKNIYQTLNVKSKSELVKKSLSGEI